MMQGEIRGDGDMTIQLFQDVVLVKTLEAENLRQGDLAVLIDWVAHPAGGEDGAILELFNALGESIRTVVVPASAIAPITANLIPTVRKLAA